MLCHIIIYHQMSICIASLIITHSKYFGEDLVWPIEHHNSVSMNIDWVFDEDHNIIMQVGLCMVSIGLLTLALAICSNTMIVLC